MLFSSFKVEPCWPTFTPTLPQLVYPYVNSECAIFMLQLKASAETETTCVCSCKSMRRANSDGICMRFAKLVCQSANQPYFQGKFDTSVTLELVNQL